VSTNQTQCVTHIETYIATVCGDKQTACHPSWDWYCYSMRWHLNV